MVSAFCIAAPTRPLPRLFPAVCASTPRSPAGNAPHCLTTVLGGSSQYICVETVGFGMVDETALIIYRPSPKHSITPRLIFVKRGVMQTRITREELHIAAQRYLFYHLLVAVRVRRVAGLAIWSDLARLHRIWAGTRLSMRSLPPAARGITWSAVNDNGCAVLRPQ